MLFLDVLSEWPKARVAELIASRTPADVERALSGAEMDMAAFAALISPAAAPYLERMAAQASDITRRRHGNAMFLYAPLYLSNVCHNACAYCGFSARHAIERTTLDDGQIDREMAALAQAGFRQILLLTGEAPNVVGLGYLLHAADICRRHVPALDIEVWPMEVDEYRQCFDHGIAGITVYQETYDRERYAVCHPAGRKRDFAWRLQTPSRAAEAGFRRVGIGALLGLSDWRYDAFCTALHAQYLVHCHWRASVSVSCPRLRPMAGAFQPHETVSDAELAQYLCALRCFGPDLALTLSTRESAAMRDGLVRLGVTRLSAQSSTAPGGYADAAAGDEQFAIHDARSLADVCAMLSRAGFDPVFKDWDEAAVRELSDCAPLGRR